MPEPLIQEWMQDLQAGDAVGLARGNDGVLTPTKVSQCLSRYNYTIRRGSVNDKLFAFQKDNQKSRLGKSANPQAMRTPKYSFKRGLGAARLQLKRAAQKRGRKGRLISMVVGNSLIKVKVPKHLGAMPTIEVLLFVATMDHTGHINWPTNFDADARAALRTQFRKHLRAMLDDPMYPVDPAMEAAMTGRGSDLVRVIPPKRKMVSAAIPA